jgi:hypothetical protein
MPTSKLRKNHKKKAAARGAVRAQKRKTNERKMKEMIEHLKAQAKATFDEAKRKNNQEEE